MSSAQKLLAAILLALCFAAGLCLHFAEQGSPIHGQGQLQAVIVEDSAHRTPTIGAVISAPEVLAIVAQDKIAWHVVDQAENGPDIAEVQWALDAAQSKPLPALCLRHGSSKPKIIPLPATPAAAVLALRAAE